MEITDIKKYSFSVKGYVSYDYLYFKNETNKINKERLKFILYESTIGNRPAVIGLEYPRITEVYNIFTILKEMDIITSYNWMVNYTSSMKEISLLENYFIILINKTTKKKIYL